MKISVHTMAVDSFVPMLRNLSRILDKGAAHANAKNLDSAALVNAKLAPDMFALALQIQIACDHAKDTAARLTGAEPPRYENAEQTFDDLKARIEKTIGYVERARAAAFEGAEDRDVKIPVPGTTMAIEMNGLQFLRDYALPNFYFHVATAYDILRHNGVEIGKIDYLSHVGQYVRQGG
ncbi:MAG: DUF1993 family protein [Rhizomicrobium sp.]